jgi:ubiquinone/menaquinone biosynthesis C-methylase UbiE
MNDSRVGRYMDAVEKDIIARHLPDAPLHVLDLGGGTGRWSRWLAEHQHQQLMFDIELAALRRFREHNPGLRVIQADAQCIPTASAIFDAVIAVQIFNFMSDTARFLAEVHRVLKPGGLLTITWTNKNSIKGLLYGTYSTLKGTSPAERFSIYGSSHSENLNLLHEAGFRVCEATGYSWSLLPRSHNTRLVDVFIAMERGLRLNHWLAASPNIILVAQKSDASSD